MQNSFRFDVKTRWLLLATTTLVVYCIVPVRRDAMFDLDAVSTWLRILLFVLTFPLGTFFVMFVNALAGVFGDSSVDGYSISGGVGVVEQFQMWAVALAGGFLQWFFIVPTLLGRRRDEVTTLNLSAAAGAPAVANAQTGRALPESDANMTTDVPPIPQFDERGRTPFERILNSDDDSNKTHGSAPHSRPSFSDY